jgi:hypothetical protein
MHCVTVNGVMKNFRHFLLRVTRQSPPVYRQMELSLPGSRVTRDEASFLRELRQLREQLAVPRT